jgi:TonB family protein
MLTALRTRRRLRRPLTWPAVAIALVVHGTVYGAVSLLGLTFIGGGGSAATTRPALPPDDTELAASCFDNAVFATSGRTALCFAPWIASVDDCLADAQMSLWMDLSSCQARNDRSVAISMLPPRAAERLTPIDPERLLEEVKPPEKRTAPPPQPPQPQVAAAAPPPPPPPPARQLPQQVIETVKPSDEKEPENARFLAEYNTKVDKQTVSRGARNEPMVAKAKPEELTPKDKPREDLSVQKHEPDRVTGRNEQAPDVPGRLSMRNPGALFPSQAEQEAKTRGSTTGATGSQVADGYTAHKGDGALEQQRRERSEIPRGQGGAGGGAPEVPNLKPTEEVLERVMGGGSVDHLEDVDNGDETSLSAKRWVYASFFNRLKRQVAQNWDPNSVWRRTDPTGTVYGTKTRVTEVRVSLSPKGALAKIVVVTPSGSVELDDEAVRAFRVAAPFPNPPDGLVQKDNLITFGFSFYFQLGTQHLSWRLPQAM